MSVFSNPSLFFNIYQVYAQIDLPSSFQISPSDNLPKKICHKCRYIVEICYDLRNTAIKSNKLLCDSVEAVELMDEVAQAIKMTSGNVDFCNNDALSDLITNHDEDTDQLLEEEIKSVKKSKRKENKLNFFKNMDLNDDVKKELCPESGDMVTECKMEFNDKGNDEKRSYTSSKDVVLDEIKIDSNIEVQLSSNMSDDGASGIVMTEKLIYSTFLVFLSIDYISDSIMPQKELGLCDKPTKQIACQLCLKTFVDRSSLLAHVDNHYFNSNLLPYFSISRPFLCQDCNLNFTTKTDLIIHHREHLDINPYTCKVAGCHFDIKTKVCSFFFDQIINFLTESEKFIKL